MNTFNQKNNHNYNHGNHDNQKKIMVKTINVPKLRFREFVGEWDVKVLADFLDFKNGVNASKEQYGSGYKFINVLDIINNDFITHDKIIGVVNIDGKTFKNYEVTYGDILFQRSSETREEVGQSNVYLDKNQNATFGGFVIRGKKIANYNPIYMNYLLKTSKVRDEITSKSGGSTRYNIGQDILKKIPIYITSTDAEQQKIANFLSAIDKKIEQISQKLSLLEQYKKGVMQQIFSQKIRFKDDNGEVFADWEVKRLGDVCSFFSGGTPKSTNKSYYTGNIAFIGSGNIHDSEVFNFISEEAFNNSSSKLIKKGDLLLALYGANSGDVAISKMDGAINQAILCIRSKSQNINFLLALLLLNKERIIAKYLQGGQGNLSANIIKKLNYYFPSLPEQQKIANFLSSIDNKIQQTQAQLEQMQEFKKGLLQQLFV